MRCARPFDDGGLADAGLADEHRIVLRAAREHLDHAADLLVAADHRIELVLSREIGEIATVAFERLVLALGILIRDALIASHGGERLEDPLVGHAALLEQRRRGARPGSAAIASSRCSVLTNSSLNRSISSSALLNTARSRGDRPG